ncbi:MAG: hypothetical protein HZB99_02450 [Candidatus Harrisonbacteria bacterium]|nr:hypothetical protein [Candidatus Harrisonbacteria bacterium]
MEHERWPKDTKDTLYIESSYNSINLGELWGKIQLKWPSITMKELEITAEHIHTDHLSYDLYDSSDYTNFLCITASPEYFKRTAKPEVLTATK